MHTIFMTMRSYEFYKVLNFSVIHRELSVKWLVCWCSQLTNRIILADFLNFHWTFKSRNEPELLFQYNSFQKDKADPFLQVSLNDKGSK